MSAGDLFAHLLAEGQVTRANHFAAHSANTYESYLRAYEHTLRETFEMDPYRLREDKIVAFITFKKEQGRAFQTLQLFIQSFSWYCRQSGVDNGFTPIGQWVTVLLMCLSSHLVMEVGEVLALKVKNLEIHEETCLLSCRFEKTKADQFAVGVTS